MSVTVRAPGLGVLVPLVAFGGALGGGARALLTTALSPQPVGTLLVNVVGCFALGVLLGRVGAGAPALRAFLGTGVLGGFTTWSALALEVDRLLVDRPVLAAGYLAASLAGGLLAARAGLRLGRR